MNIHVTDAKYDEGRVNAAVALLSHKDLGAPIQMVDASPFRVRVLQNTDTDLKPIKDDPVIPRSTLKNPTVGKSVRPSEFWWPGMDADIDQHIAMCVMCQAATNKRNKHTTVSPITRTARTKQECAL
jgi:hypothetical protein